MTLSAAALTGRGMRDARDPGRVTTVMLMLKGDPASIGR